jgi:hypothetical protein
MDQQPGQQGSGPPQYSADGRWWWDGQRWVAVNPHGPAGQGIPVAHKRPPAILWIGIGALVLVMGICTVAVASSAASKKSAPAARSGAQTDQAAAAPTATSASTAKATAIPRDGSCSPQPCANDNYGWIVTIANLRYDAPGGSFTKPEAGNVFVTMDVTFTNRLDQEQHANPTEFVLQDAAGIKHTVTFFLDGPCGTWQPVNLTKGATLGPKCIAFEAAAGKPAGLTLVWTPGGFGGGYAIKLT